MYKEDYDPEGILSTLPSIASSLLGVFTGLILVSARARKERILIGLGVILVVLGYLWDTAFPINKPIWTSSYVLVTAGWANICLAVIYYLTDVKGLKFGSIFKYAGANAITVYFLSSWISKIFYQVSVSPGTSLHQWLFENIFVFGSLTLKFSSLLYGLCVIAFYMILAYAMYRKKIFIKV
jgi:predicted acyltransferase